MFVMADKEDQLKLTSNEIKKFRKKLRQIKNLEELDRDLSEEELLKVRIWQFFQEWWIMEDCQGRWIRFIVVAYLLIEIVLSRLHCWIRF